MPLLINANRTILVNEVIDLPNQTGSAIEIADASPAITLTNLGTINVSTSGGASAVASNASGSHGHGVFINEASGTVNATAVGQAGMTGFRSFNGMGDFYNRGHFNVIATQGYATGVDFNGSSNAIAPLVDNSGFFVVQGLLQAIGVHFTDTGIFRNSGSFEVSGSSEYTIGVWIGGTTTFENSGTLRAVSNVPTQLSVAVYISDGSQMFNEIGSYRNSGLIEGDWAFKVFGTDFYSFETIINTGTIHGDFSLGRAIDLVTNAGTIVGDIALGDDDDLYNGIGGTLDGLVYAGDGADRLIGGSGVENLFGEGGNDALSGGLGDDFLEGGSGADAIDGGGGFDTLSYQAFAGSVTVDLTTGRAIGDGQDRISGIERVIGGQGADSMLGTGGAETFEGRTGDDVLNGGGGIDTLIGGAGNDSLTGGAGNDAFVYSIGSGQDTVTDFVAGGTDDALRIYGYTAYQSLQQIGADTRVNLSGADWILLKNVQASSLTSADFVFNAQPLVTPPSPPSPPVSTNKPLTIYDDLYVIAGETLALGQQGMLINQNRVDGAYPNLWNAGTILGTGVGGVTGITVETGNPSTVYNMAGGLMEFTSTSDHGVVYGWMGSGAFNPGGVFNAGVFRVIALQGTAVGISEGPGFEFEMVNTGLLEALGGEQARGIEVSDRTVFNSGTIHAKATGGQAFGVYFANFEATLVNSGTIFCEGLQSSAVAWAYTGSSAVIYNSGTIQAGRAIDIGGNSPNGAADTVYNTGSIVGDIYDGQGVLNVYNWNSIVGKIDLLGGDDLYDGRGGTQSGGVYGGDGNDTLLAGAGANVLDGGAGADVLYGGAGADNLTGGSGQDQFRYDVGSGADTVTDFAAGSAGDVFIVSGYASFLSAVQQGANTLVTFAAGDTLLLLNVTASQLISANFQFLATPLAPTPTMPAPPTAPTPPAPPASPDSQIPPLPILGDANANTMIGTVGDDAIFAAQGDDTVEGGKGNDGLSGGTGADLFIWRAGDGVDIIYDFNAAEGDLVYFDNLTTIEARGGFGLALYVAEGAYVNLMGIGTSDGYEQLFVLGKTGSAGADTLNGTTFNDWIDGAGGDDILFGDSGHDRLRGQDGNDTLKGGTGNDVLDGGNGVDTADYSNQAAAVVFSLALTTAQAGNLDTGLDTFLAVENLIGTNFADTLSGSTAANRLDGLAGNDVLKGDAGDDVLNGGDDNDIIEGGAGNDTLSGGNGIDKADYRTATAAVTVNLSILTAQNTVGAGTDTLSGLEQVLGSAFNDTLTGDAGANTLDGKNGNDTLKGGSGGDILIGGLGADALDGGGDLDYASYINATVAVGINLTTGVHAGEALGDTFANIERYRLSAFNDSFVGSAATDYAYGAEGADTLSGAGGVDRLYGQDGNDTLNGDAGNDILLGGAGADVFNGGADRDTASYEESAAALTINLTTGVHTGEATGDTFTSIEVLWLTKFNDTFNGSAANDEVRGYDGLDTLNGAAGADVLRGELGNDTLNGDDGDDVLHGGAGADKLNGGQGTDTASYLLATSGVGINLTTLSHGGEAIGDTFTSIEHYQLSNGFTLNDFFTGAAGDDWVAGYKGVDTINGMDGNDTINGGDHNDVLSGGNGDDKLIGEGGNDSLTGGAGADQFRVTTALFGADAVTDFQNGVDKIRVTGVAGWDNFNDIVVSTNGSGWAVLTFPDGSTMTLTGVTANLIDASDFLWS